MRKNLAALFFVMSIGAHAQQAIQGTIIDAESGKPVVGASVSNKQNPSLTISDQNGTFTLNTSGNEVHLQISKQGFYPFSEKFKVPLTVPLLITLRPKTTNIEEVTLTTGYQKIPKERATGSFSSVTEAELNKLVTPNVADRLAALANSVTWDSGTSDQPQLTVRGISTIKGPRQPLIVLEDFPYEGNLSNINPNMVESITILKDAAAASIWGARAANGVIVITTKKGKANQPINISFNANTTIGGKPDLSYIRQMSASDFISVEQRLFDAGFYDSEIDSPLHPAMTPVVDILNKKKKGLLSEEQASQMIGELRKIDTRDQYSKYMYQMIENRQYALNLSGGNPLMSWSSGLGYDDNVGNLGQTYRRFNIQLQNTWKLANKVNLNLGAIFTRTKEKSGRVGYGSITYGGNSRVPYLSFADGNGEPLAIPFNYDPNYLQTLNGKGLLDWRYFPLTDWQDNTQTSDAKEVILNAGLQYKIIPGLDAEIKYQYQNSTGDSEQLYNKNSYYSRNYVNSFAQWDDSGKAMFIIPKGGILDTYASRTEINNIRGQINFNRVWKQHAVTAIAGAETRETKMHNHSNRYYGFNEDTQASANVDFTNLYPNLITGSLEYIIPNQSMQMKNIRFASLYANGAYTYDKRYTVSASIRRDASNLFGLKTNDQWNPFWSVGSAWNINNEKFFSVNWLSNLKLRSSYGFNGNIDPSMVALTTIIYDTMMSPYTGTPTARIDNFYNPNLRWETSRIINLGIDFATQNERIAGTVEWFTKTGTNLFGTAQLDYTTGINNMLMNVAGMKGVGMDITLKTRNIISKSFQWDTQFNMSTYKDQITDYYLKNTLASSYVPTANSGVGISGTVGMPVYAIFAYRWAGLDPQTGDPRGYLNGEVSTNYAAILNSDKGIEGLKYFGSAIPTVFGSLMNTFSYKGFSVDLGITYKLGYWFRRGSINYNELVNSGVGHSDYAIRWQNPGDENHTNIPSEILTSNATRDKFFAGSEVLVEKADHVRMQFITLNWQLSPDFLKNLAVKRIELYGSVNNVGLIWKANAANLDPDYSFGNESLKPVTTYSVGFRANF